MPRIIIMINDGRPSSGHPGRDLPLPLLWQGQAKDELVRGRRAVSWVLRHYPIPPAREN